MSTVLRYAPFLGIGVTLIVTGYAPAGASILATAGLVAIGHAVREQQWKSSTDRMAAWLIEAAQYGTKYIQNATDHDISDVRDVPRLDERHKRWMATIKAHADEYLNSVDADQVGWLHAYEVRNMRGFNADHTRIRDWTSIRVERMRALALRLQSGQTQLKKYWP